ncbi:hypothetical protein BKA70DRAFT_1290913 [Coprinopsis sp. MPI-PUGE-AT-0042]|nr:hypothetical protein BKA70DRAFT_1290913 [Coprinopsis sp. MPI-PUGE-AT-0042]
MLPLLPVFPTELILKVIGNLERELPTLKSLSLVCSNLQIASQKVLFARVKIILIKKDAILRVQHLNSSPRLVSYIRSLQLSFCIAAYTTRSDWLNTEGPILLSFLQLISVDSIHSFSFIDQGNPFTGFPLGDPPMASNLWDAIGSVCAGTSLRTVELIDGFNIGILLRCGRSVKDVYVGAPFHINRPSERLSTSSVPIPLENFALSGGGNVERYMLSPGSPFNFQHLTYLHLHNPQDQHLPAILEQCQDTLTTLVYTRTRTLVDFLIHNTEQSVGLARLRNLKSLHLVEHLQSVESTAPAAAASRIRWLTEELAQLDHPSSLEQFLNTYLVEVDNPPKLHNIRDWDTLSDLLSTSTLFPNLTKVEVSVEQVGPRETAEFLDSCNIFQQGIAEFPSFRKLSAKGILTSRFRRYGDHSSLRPGFLPDWS